MFHPVNGLGTSIIIVLLFTTQLSLFQNEVTLKKCVADLQGKLKKQEQKNQAIKEKAEEKIEA